MSDNEDFSLYGDDSPECRNNYTEECFYSNSLCCDSPTSEPEAEMEKPPVKVEVGESSTIATVKAEIRESSTFAAVKTEPKVKAEIKEEIKEEEEEEEGEGSEWYKNWLRRVDEMSGEEDEEEVEDDNPKLLQARKKIKKIFRKARPNTPLPQLFKKFQRLIRTGNCQGTMIDAVWDAWQSIFHVEWDLFEPRVRDLKRRMYERRHWYAGMASWGFDN